MGDGDKSQLGRCIGRQMCWNKQLYSWQLSYEPQCGSSQQQARPGVVTLLSLAMAKADMGEVQESAGSLLFSRQPISPEALVCAATGYLLRRHVCLRLSAAGHFSVAVSCLRNGRDLLQWWAASLLSAPTTCPRAALARRSSPVSIAPEGLDRSTAGYSLPFAAGVGDVAM